jgi:hypothetical protein
MTQAWEWGRKMAAIERRVIEYLIAHPTGVTYAELGLAIGDGSEACLAHLRRIGHVRRTGRGRPGDPFRHFYVGAPAADDVDTNASEEA